MAYHADNALPSHSEGERVLPMQKGGKQRLKKSDIWVTGSFDVPFLALSLLLLTIGLVMLFSASYAYAFYNDDGNSYAYISRQLIFAVVGLVARFILSKLYYKVIQAATVPLLLVTLALLCLVLVYHTNLRGFRRCWGLAACSLGRRSALADHRVVAVEQNRHETRCPPVGAHVARVGARAAVEGDPAQCHRLARRRVV